MVQQALRAAEHEARWVAADGGVRVARHFGRDPDVILGDMDSISPEALAQMRELGAEIHEFPAEKDETDLELALTYAAEQGATWVRVFGALGGRFDQMLANAYLLALPILRDIDVALVAGEQRICMWNPGEHLIYGAVGDTVSLMPVGGDVQGIRSEGLRYALHDETLEFGPARGISNVLLTECATVRFVEGVLLVVHTRGRA